MSAPPPNWLPVLIRHSPCPPGVEPDGFLDPQDWHRWRGQTTAKWFDSATREISTVGMPSEEYEAITGAESLHEELADLDRIAQEEDTRVDPERIISEGWQLAFFRYYYDPEYDAEYDVLPDAGYDFVIHKASHRKTSAGLDMFRIRVVVESGPYTRSVLHHAFIVDPDDISAMRAFFRQMSALGLGRPFWTSNPHPEQVAAALENRRFRAMADTVEISPHFKVSVLSRFRSPSVMRPISTTPMPPPPPPPPAPARPTFDDLWQIAETPDDEQEAS